MNLREYERLALSVAEAEREVERSKGALQQIVSLMRTKYGCNNIEEAEKKLREMKDKMKRLEKSIDVETEAFLKKWKR